MIGILVALGLLTLSILLIIGGCKKILDKKENIMALGMGFILGILSVWFLINSIIDLIDKINNNYETISGKCEVNEMKSTYRGGYHYFQFNFEQITLTGEKDEYGDLKEDTEYYCNATYLKNSKEMKEIDIQEIK